MLGSLSEEGLETTNEHIQRYLEPLARRSSPVDKVTNIISQLLQRSNPIVLAKQTTITKKLTCLESKSHEHIIQGHSKTAMRPKKISGSEVEVLLI